MLGYVWHDGNPLARGGQTAELRPPQLGYRALPGIRFSCDASALGVHHLVTNDGVEPISEVEFRWLGRIDHVVNTGRIKVFPEQVEAKLGALFSSRFFLSKERYPKWDERLVLLLESAPFPLRKSDFQCLGLVPYEMPKKVYFLPRFVETPTGKLQRTQTLALLKGGAAGEIDLSL